MRVQTAVGGEPVELDVATRYPWDGTVEVEVLAAPDSPWTLSLRIPAWVAGAGARVRVTVNGRVEDVADEPGTYARLHRRWSRGDVVTLSLPMPPRLTWPDDRIDAVRGCVAIERGPLVCCIEQTDQEAPVDEVRIEDGPMTAVAEAGLLGGVTTVEARGR